MSIMFSFLLKRWKEVLIVLLIGIILFLKGCGSEKNSEKEIINVNGKDYELLEHTIDTVYKEKVVKVPTYVPQYVEKIVTETVEVEIPMDVDSLAIIRDYFASYKIVDTLNLSYDFSEKLTDSLGNKPNSNLGFGVITDVISQNKIQSRDITWNYRIPIVYDTKIVKELPKNELYYGFGAAVDKLNGFNNVSGNLLFKNKKLNIYGVNVGVFNQNGQYQPFVGGSVYWKLGKK